jgi:hypothetical protein
MFLFFRAKETGKMQWVQDPSQSNVEYLNNVRFEAGRDIRKKKEGISGS